METVPREPEALNRAIVAALGVTLGSCDNERSLQAYRYLLERGWDRMRMVVGDEGACAIVEYAVKGASKQRPLVALVTVGDQGPELSELDAEGARSGPTELCLSLRELCFSIIKTLVELTGSVVTGPLLEEMEKWREEQHAA